MRILSQDGRIDLPYEKFSLSITQDNCIVATRDVVASMEEILIGVIAKYSTEEKAKKAMEMLRNFNEVREVRNIPIRKDIVDTMFEPLRKLFQIYTKGDEEIWKMDLVKVGNYFRFPTDEEIEV